MTAGPIPGYRAGSVIDLGGTSMRDVFLGMLLLVLTAACGMMVEGRDAFKAQAIQREANFPVSYQAMFRCFTDRAPIGYQGIPFSAGGPSAALYSELHVAEYKRVAHDHWATLIEFRRRTASETHVSAFDVMRSNLDQNWRIIEACGSRK